MNILISRFQEGQQSRFFIITALKAIRVSLNRFYPKNKWTLGSSGVQNVSTGQWKIGRNMCLRTSAAYTRPVEETYTSQGDPTKGMIQDFSQQRKLMEAFLFLSGAEYHNMDLHLLSVLYQKRNADHYLKILKQVAVPFLESLDLEFQQDNASTHTAEIIQHYFDQKGIEPLQWSPHSPDLSIIENIWHLLKLKLPVKVYENRDDFVAAIRLAWTQIGQDVVDALFTKQNKGVY
ncbi:DDE_superfamily endonuclease domain-containing protein [Hexamita inflata]|uniref:DDE_superfamily endonuclease domain-containing protein n=1 Tax=Hexamita inflata TaxID=28002 RepID=A0ABP1LLQ9_9EUKA